MALSKGTIFPQICRLFEKKTTKKSNNNNKINPKKAVKRTPKSTPRLSLR